MNIRLVTLVVLLGLVAADLPAEPDSPCDLCLDGVCYNKSKLTDSDSIPDLINYAFDRAGNTLYYSDLRNAIFALNLEDKTIKQIRYNEDDGAMAVDQTTRDLYIAAGNDIFKYNPVTNKTDRIPTEVEVKKLRFKDKLYIKGRNETSQLYTLEESGLELIAALKDIHVIDYFVIDKFGDIYFTEPWNENFRLSNFKVSRTYGRREFMYTTDKNDEIYLIDVKDKSVLRMDYSRDLLVSVGAFDPKAYDSLYTGVLFDNDNNVIFVDRNPDTAQPELIRLAASTKHCRVIPKIVKLFY